MPRIRRTMTTEAVVNLSLKSRFVAGFLTQRIKHRTEGWFRRRDFQHFSVVTKAHVGIVVEINRSRRPRRDSRSLKTCLRKDENLGRNRDLERLQHRLQIAETIDKLDRLTAVIKPRLETRN